MQRVMIIGQPGSGKSRLAHAVGQRTGLPVIHIDTIHWQPGWIERSFDEKTRLCREIEARDQWIFEGGHSATWDNRVARADLLIWIDRASALRFWRVLLRTLLQRGRSRPDLPEDCPEMLGNLPEFFRFMWETRRSARARMKQFVATVPAGCRVVHLRSNRQTRRFLESVEVPSNIKARANQCDAVELPIERQVGKVLGRQMRGRSVVPERNGALGPFRSGR